jgi:hypothetical protein
MPDATPGRTPAALPCLSIAPAGFGGGDAALAAISRSDGCALVIPFREQLLLAVLGKASGFPPEKNQLIDHCTKGTEGGAAWGAGRWDHWPIGWLNSQFSIWKPADSNGFLRAREKAKRNAQGRFDQGLPAT